MLIQTALFSPRKLQAIEDFESSACSLGLEIRVHPFGGTGFFSNGCELAHLHGNGLFDALVGAAQRDEALAKYDAIPHHVFPQSGWVSFWMHDPEDVRAAVGLTRLAKTHRQAHWIDNPEALEEEKLS